MKTNTTHKAKKVAIVPDIELAKKIVANSKGLHYFVEGFGWIKNK